MILHAGSTKMSDLKWLYIFYKVVVSADSFALVPNDMQSLRF